ncbi:hypothetical protein RRA70_04960, partial [Streptococcus pneumoniae]|nr:hypothetical protein [Streptococcus pneumoniae]MDS8615926.1 hypothetical protein [Streptococcus pneumoniae]MDT6178832.1 hypothetical protein [Streptococcus pneumoniae]
EKRNHPGSKLRQGFWMVFRFGVNNWGQRKMISKNSVILSEFFVFSFTLLPCIFSHFLPK